MWKSILMEKTETTNNSLQTVPHVFGNFKQYSETGPSSDVTKHIEITCFKDL